MSEPLPQTLRAAWRATTHDPVYLLAPAAALLLVDLVAVLVVRASLDRPWATLAAVAGALLVVRWVVGAPLRGALLQSAAGAIEEAAPLEGSTPSARHGPLRRTARILPLLAVLVVVDVAQVAAALLVGVPVLVLGAWAAARGWVVVGTLLAALGLLIACIAAYGTRVALAYAPIEAALYASGAFRALMASLARARSQFASLVAILLLRDVAVIVGGLACGAGALPGFPIADVALVYRRAREGT